jgi:hypothetical protein
MRGVGRDARSSLALALVGRDVVKATEDLESGVTLDAVLLAEIGLLCAVHLRQLDALVFKLCRGILVLWGKRLAVTAPRGVDWDGAVSKCSGAGNAREQTHTLRERCRWP